MSFIQSLVELAPKRFKQLVEAADKENKESESKQTQAYSGPTLQDYYDLLNENIKHMQEIVNLKLTKNIPLEAKDGSINKLIPLWQKSNFPSRRMYDSLDRNIQYEFVHISREKYIHPDLEEYVENLFEAHRN